MRASDSTPLGTLNAQSAKILQVIAAADNINTEMFCLNKCEPYSPSTKRKTSNSRNPVQIFVILYGTMDSFEYIGDFFQKCTIYLQDPWHCTRNVPYRNPHRLSGLDDEVGFTIGTERGSVNVENIRQQRDPFAEFETLDYDAETEGPQALKTKLLT